MKYSKSRAEVDTMLLIAKRAESLGIRPDIDRITRMMDLDACHSNGTPLDLQKLLDAPNADFIHDVAGIHAHMNRETGKIEDHFLPRSSR